MEAWKRLEKSTAPVLGGQRVLRLTAPEPCYLSCADVELLNFPRLQIDAKYCCRWTHHWALREIERPRDRAGISGAIAEGFR